MTYPPLEHCRAERDALRVEVERGKTDYELLSDDYQDLSIDCRRLRAQVKELEGLYVTLGLNHGTAIAERDEMEARVEGLEEKLGCARAIQALIKHNYEELETERDEARARVAELEHELAKAKGKPWDG